MSDAALERLLQTMFMAHPWHGLDPGDPEGALLAFIEIAPTDALKYELDKSSGHLKVDRPQRYSSLTPTPYGFIPRTYCGKRVGERCATRLGLSDIDGDKDPIDICLLTENPVAHGALCRARLIGGLRVLDGNEADDKLVAVLDKDLAYGHLSELRDVPAAVTQRLEHYFLSYKQLPGSGPRVMKVGEIYDRAEAIETLRCALADYRDQFGAPEVRVQQLKQLLK